MLSTTETFLSTGD